MKFSLKFGRPTATSRDSESGKSSTSSHNPNPGGSTSVTSGAKIPDFEPQKQGKLVFVHFMVGNTYPYSQQDWVEDLELATSNDIDGFVLNIGIEAWQKERVESCFKASERLEDDGKFKFMLSFDMTSLPGGSIDDTRPLVTFLSSFAEHPRMFRHPRSGRIVVSTFSGENCHFGKDGLNEGWAYMKQELSFISPIDLVPAFFLEPTEITKVTSLDGIFNWNGCWPVHLSRSHSLQKIDYASLDSDSNYLRYLKRGNLYMASVSPWFFTHYGPDSWNKNWVYCADDWLFVRRWEQLIEMRNQIDFVQVISWNDYGESHYIGPIKGAQPNSQAWVDGYPHEAWLHLNSYFSRAFKTGVYPEIDKDKIYVWARPHPKDAIADDQVPRPDNWELTQDLMWIVVYAIAPAMVEIYTSESKIDMRRVEVGTGISKLSSPLKAGGGIKLIMSRDGAVVATCNPVEYWFDARPRVYNFNAFVAMSA